MGGTSAGASTRQAGTARLRTLDDLDVAGRRVLVRVDFNVPMADGRIVDDRRIRAAVPTLTELLDRGATLVLASHLGRPQGRPRDDLRLRSVSVRLQELLDHPVGQLDQITGQAVLNSLGAADPGSVTVLENLRFDPGEEANDPAFVKALAATAELYVDDAFGAAHRPHASVVGVTELLPSAAGRLMEREVRVLSRLLGNPEPPFLAVLGGAKVSDKLGVLDSLIERCDAILVGGAMAFSFLAASGQEVGGSLVEPDRYEMVRGAMSAAQEKGVDIVLPLDVVAATGIDDEAVADRTVVPAGRVPFGLSGLDIGPETVALFAGRIANARTVLWNGPMGVFEVDELAAGTRGVARAVADCPGFTVVGGGDSLAAIAKLQLEDRIGHLSTGGGASLEFIEGRELPGVAVLMERI